MKKIGWEHEFSELFSEENRKYLKKQLLRLNILRLKNFLDFLKEFCELSSCECITVWFTPPPQKQPESDKLKYFSHTYILHISGNGEITLDKNSPNKENLIEIEGLIIKRHCGEGLSAIRSILKQLL